MAADNLAGDSRVGEAMQLYGFFTEGLKLAR
jgi:hypothetical protein